MAQNGITWNFQRLISAFACACMLFAGGTTQASPSQAETWKRIDDSPADFLFLRGDADLAGFDKIMIDPLSVWYANKDAGSGLAVNENVERLCAAFNRKFYESFTHAGYEIVTKPGEGVLRLHVEIIDMKLNTSEHDAKAYSSRYLFAVVPGQITLVANLQDSQTGEILLRMADVEKETDNRGTQPLPIWEQVNIAFEHWSNTLSASIGGMRVNQDLRMVQTIR